MTNRRTFLLSAGGALFTQPWSTHGRSQDSQSYFEQGPEVGLEPVISGLADPVSIAFPPGNRNLMYIVQQWGQILIVDEGQMVDEPLLDLTEEMVLENWEMGLLDIALHPDFENNRKLYVRYSGRLNDAAPMGYSHSAVLEEYHVTANFKSVRPDSARTILSIPQPGQTHNGGAITFGPDGYLYAAYGDGGGNSSNAAPADTGLGHASDWYEINEGGNGQDVTANLLGSILRTDVDQQWGDQPYAIPEDNPLVGTKGLDEHYAWGFRNPWRMSFTDGHLIVGDVGRGLPGEVDIVQKGGNYGWNVREGPNCFFTGEARDSCPTQTPDGDPLISPVASYPRTHNGQLLGTSLIGGYIYQQDTVSGLTGNYVFGDLRAEESGRLFIASPTIDGGKWPMKELQVSGDLKSAVLAFGRDPSGELYVLTTQFEGGSGTVSKIVPTSNTTTPTTTATNTTSNSTTTTNSTATQTTETKEQRSNREK